MSDDDAYKARVPHIGIRAPKPLVTTNSVETRPLTAGRSVFTSVDQGLDWAIISAATPVSSGPLLIAFLLFQRQFMQFLMRAVIR